MRLTGSATADAFIDNVWKLHGMPDEIISDRGAQFNNTVWNRLMERLHVARKLSTAYHPQTNGQAEAANKAVQRYLAAFVNWQQDDWVDYLPLAEFCINDTRAEAIGMTPFEADCGYRPRGFATELAEHTGGVMPNADLLVAHFQELDEMLRARLSYVQAQIQQTEDQNRQEAQTLRAGDFDWLNTRNLKSKRPSKKLDVKWVGPFPIAAVVDEGRAYRLRLSESMGRVHDVFHPSLLALDTGLPLPGQETHGKTPEGLQSPDDDDTPTADEYEVSDVVNSRNCNKRVEYQVKWSGGFETTWQPAADLENAADLVADFHHA
jgi:hypothetical protein